ncbi:hypothetical protein [Methylobacterium haplocladii]|uniref:Uncharacterized protein n=1 Tax=Methylobacterium haplocladii TaxID=1176176 RepID=A0A512IKT0_9HYPH|nr:hypothetical protein [Methylobacterium haplocladii]GEO98306.1 hypothetical protein MHA02_06940 [Methylobacterium haplocladii]GJD86384.1 hypothetical protein HPGCJGGD_4290 [Methylobacterium haplocladii]GLS58400.1 hypothetical protein GCM10007887_10600 [Methylobacterium haplocladii]
MSLFLGFFSLTVATTLATGAAAVLWAKFVGKGMDERDGVERRSQTGLDIRTW